MRTTNPVYKKSGAPIHVQNFKSLWDYDEDIRSAFIGNILGDAYIELRGNKSRFQFSASSKHLDYLLFLHQLYSQKGFCSTTIPSIRAIKHYSGKYYETLRFQTYFLKSINEVHTLFYRLPTEEELAKHVSKRKLCYIKQIPPNIAELLTPQALAFWYMDDGSFDKQKGFICIGTNAFTKEEVELLCHTLEINFNLIFQIKTDKRPQGYNQWVIYLSRKQFEQFAQIVKPFMVPSMYYKLGLI
jgi:hypothetical protein